jgi:hypothetical protein
MSEDVAPWTLIGETVEGHVVDADMANAVQVWVTSIEKAHPDRNQGNAFIERGFHCPRIHPYFYGRSDYTYIDTAARTLHVWDYKHGAGIVVDVKDNPQCMYYGVGMLDSLDLWSDIDTVVLHIVQPRGFHPDGVNRSWSVSVEDLELWLDEVLIPAMLLAEVSRDTSSGEHCRFCPVRAKSCPQILSDFDELEEIMEILANKGGAKELSNTQIGRFLTLFDVAKIAAKAAGETAFSRLQAGKKIPGRKLASARSNRAWKDDAEAAVRKKFKEDAFTEPKLKSPAQIDKLPGGAALTARYAFKPDAGLTVVPGTDSRVAVSKDTKSLFTDQTKKGKK